MAYLPFSLFSLNFLKNLDKPLDNLLLIQYNRERPAVGDIIWRYSSVG